MVTSKMIIGLMSGTSLDGLDIAACRFDKEKSPTFEIRLADTVSYPPAIKEKLKLAATMPAIELVKFDLEYGKYLGEQVNAFLKKYHLRAELIGSHGHTVFHQPDKGLTYQIGSGKALFYKTKIPVVADFRTEDVLHGGQGAPFAPIGDKYLFGEYDYCLNLGGFSNISFEKDGKRLAFDVSPVNFVLNREAQKLGKEFDFSGEFAASASPSEELREKLNLLDYYRKMPPKSLGREWVENVWEPVTKNFHLEPAVKLSTFVEHITDQLSMVLKSTSKNGKVLLTGGGAKNRYLTERLRKKTRAEVIIPDETIVDYKEALIFAFMALRKERGETNVLSSVTGASHDLSAGTFYQ